MKQIVNQGLIGLANAGVLNGGHWFVGHFGAEVLSLTFLIINKRINKKVESLVLQRIKTVINTHAQFFKSPLSKPNVNKESSLNLKAFEKRAASCLKNLCVDGHHAIYVALALRGINEYPELARPEIIHGLMKLLDACEAVAFERYYGFNQASFVTPYFIEKFTFASAVKAVEVVCYQHNEVITDREVDGCFYFFSGSRLHLVTHAQALLELEQLGYTELAQIGLLALTKHCICVDASRVPDDAIAYSVKATLDPRQVEFWQRAKTNPHQGKLAYAILEIFSVLPNIHQQKVLNDLSAYWAFYE